MFLGHLHEQAVKESTEKRGRRKKRRTVTLRTRMRTRRK